MLTRRVRRAEMLLRRREAARHAAGCEAEGRVAALRALLAQLAEADPFPDLAGVVYLRAFWPWLLAVAGDWPVWAMEYALAVGGVPVGVGRVARVVPPPAPRPLRTVEHVVELLHEQVELVRADMLISPLERARVIGQLAGQARRALETARIEARLEALQAVLLGRKDKQS